MMICKTDLNTVSGSGKSLKATKSCLEIYHKEEIKFEMVTVVSN